MPRPPRPPATRIVHLVRHGASDYDPVVGLNERGREQVRHLVAHLPILARQVPVRSVICSGVPRARETADLVAAAIPGVRRRVLRGLREGLPSRAPGVDAHGASDADFARTDARLDAVCAALFRPVRRTHAEVVVSHGNWIRAMLARYFEQPEHAWLLRWALPYNASVTTLAISAQRRLLVRFNSVAHLPPELVSVM